MSIQSPQIASASRLRLQPTSRGSALRRGMWLALLLLCGLSVPQSHVCAQPDEELIDEWFMKAEASLGRGRDRKGLALLIRVLEAQPDDLEAMALALPAAVNTGELAKADGWSKRLLAAKPEDRVRRIARVEVLLQRGKTTDAVAALKPLLQQVAEPGPNQLAIDLEAAALRARVHLGVGERDEAKVLYDLIIEESRRVIIKEPHDLMALSDAYIFYRGMREAEKVLVEAQATTKKRKLKDPKPSLALARLYRDHFYLPGDAAEEYKAALEIRPKLAIAHWELGEAYDSWQKGQEATLQYRLARRVNPRLDAALVHTASKALGDLEVAKAETAVSKLLEDNPNDLRGLTLSALVKMFQGDPTAFETELKGVFERNPLYSDAHLLIAEVFNERRRWPEALERCRLATRIDPKNPVAFDALARYAFFLGLEEEGMKALREADLVDKFSQPWRKNMFEVMRVLKAYYEEVKSRHFIHRVHKQEMQAFKPYIMPWCEASYRLLTKKYGYVPEGLATAPGKILVEWFRDHGGFSVRTLGFEHLGATGVCFGPFIGMDSPGSRKPGEFSWARTFHHELAHTMTVGLSKGRTPRWLTEGLSTYEEIAFDPSWSRGLYRELHSAVANDEVCKVIGFDAVFTTPRVIFAYFQAGLQCKWMVEEYGIEKIVAMLKAYGEDKTSQEVFEDVLGVDPKEIDERFLAHLKDILKPVRLQPRWSSKKISEWQVAWEEGTKDLEVLIPLTASYQDRGFMEDAQELLYRIDSLESKDPRILWLKGRMAAKGKPGTASELFEEAIAGGFDDHDMRVFLGEQAAEKQDFEKARKHLNRAIETLPMAAGPKDPRMILARLAETDNDLEEAIRQTEAHVALAYEDIKAREKLMSWYEARGADKELRRHLVAMIRINPLDSKVHRRLGDLALKEKKGDEAATEFEVALALLLKAKPEDRSPAQEADLRVSLARAYLLEGDGAEEALSEVQQALTLVPGHAAATALRKQIRAQIDRELRDRR